MGRGVFTGPMGGVIKMELSHRFPEKPSMLISTRAACRKRQRRQIRGSW